MASSKTVYGVVIPAEGHPYTTEFTGYESLKAALDGGWLEALTGDAWTMYLDEEGKVKGLPFNAEATDLWWRLQPQARGRDFLVGPVIVVGPVDDEGYDTDIRPEVLEMLKV